MNESRKIDAEKLRKRVENILEWEKTQSEKFRDFAVVSARYEGEIFILEQIVNDWLVDETLY